MTSPPETITAAVEGNVDEAAVVRICEVLGLSLRACYVKNGKSKLDASLAAYSAAAKYGRWLVIRDLDQDAECAPTLRQALYSKGADGLCLRIAVRAIESWFHGDAANIARFLGVPADRIPARPDLLDDPKSVVIELAARSRRRDIRLDMVPVSRSRREGPAYSSRMIEFALYSWDVRSAAIQSGSLARCLNALGAK